METLANIETESHRKAFYYSSLGFSREELVEDYDLSLDDVDSVQELKNQGFEDGSEFISDECPLRKQDYIANKSKRYDLYPYNIENGNVFFIIKRKELN